VEMLIRFMLVPPPADAACAGATFYSVCCGL
jgi:hypothetical protein